MALASAKVIARFAIIFTAFTSASYGELGPSGLAGRGQSIPYAAISALDEGPAQFFGWGADIPTSKIKAVSEAHFSFSVIPFAPTGNTTVELLGDNGSVVSFQFEDGRINGSIPYSSSSWTTVQVELDLLNMTCRWSADGSALQSSSLDAPTQELKGFSVSYLAHGLATQALGWFDAFSISGDDEPLLNIDFDGNDSGVLKMSPYCDLQPAVPGDTVVKPCCENNFKPSRAVAGLAGRCQTTFLQASPGNQYFEWYEPFPVRTFEQGGKATLHFFLVPFTSDSAGGTAVGLDNSEATFLWLVFENGLVNHTFPYNAQDWNEVLVLVDFDAGTYQLTLNQTGYPPEPLYVPSSSLSAFRINYNSPGLQPAVAWLDSVSLSDSKGLIFSYDFDSTVPLAPYYCSSCFSAENPVGNTGPTVTVNRSPRGLLVSWHGAQEGAILQTSETLQGPWKVVPYVATGNGSAETVEVPATLKASFFKVSNQ